MIAWRLLRVGLHILRGMLICAVVFPRVSAPQRALRVQRWSRQLLGIFRVTLEVLDGEGHAYGHANAHAGMRVDRHAGSDAGRPALPPLAHCLIVANHVSWIDIFVINSLQPCRFVAKSDIRDWPLLGYLCARSETIFISRGSPRDVRKTFKNLVASIEAGERVAFFPEGTTAAQGTLLPFHANLFEAAIDARVPVQPLALRYLDAHGRLYAGVDYIGDTTFWESMLLILRGPAIRAQIIVRAPIPSGGVHRRELALATNHDIGAALGYAPVVAGA